MIPYHASWNFRECWRETRWDTGGGCIHPVEGKDEGTKDGKAAVLVQLLATFGCLAHRRSGNYR